MQQQRRRSGIILGLLALGLLAGVPLTAGPAQAVDAVGPYYALPSWDQKKGAATRFVVLTNWSSAAVLDKETGLVWERSPSPFTFPWIFARVHCLVSTTGNRIGWRLPSFPELASLVDPSVSTGPTLPPGHPFLTVQAADYWSATQYAGDPSTAWYVRFTAESGGGVGVGVHSSGKANPGVVWCVRGGMNADEY